MIEAAEVERGGVVNQVHQAGGGVAEPAVGEPLS
jgi:hypothetical protein